MAVNVKALVTNDQITGTAAASTDTLYTAAASVRAQITQFVAYNADASPVTLTVYILASGESATTVDPIAVESITNGDAAAIAEPVGLVIPAGGTLEAYAGTTNVIRVSVAGVEFS